MEIFCSIGSIVKGGCSSVKIALLRWRKLQNSLFHFGKERWSKINEKCTSTKILLKVRSNSICVVASAMLALHANNMPINKGLFMAFFANYFCLNVTVLWWHWYSFYLSVVCSVDFFIVNYTFTAKRASKNVVGQHAIKALLMYTNMLFKQKAVRSTCDHKWLEQSVL